jgi:LuxR family maltose regulon positive regulatory protein
LSASELAVLHARAGSWFAQQGLIDEAIRHFLAAGDENAAAALVEQHVQHVLSKEDWPALANYLTLLPAALVQDNPNLLLAKAYVAHLSGRLASVREILAEIRNLLDRSDGDATVRAALRAECDTLELSQTLVIDQNPEAALSSARDAVERIPADHRFGRGVAYVTCGFALQSAGRTEEAVGWLSDIADREAERIDAGSIRAMMGLMYVHRQAGNYSECQQVSGHMLELANRHELPVSAGWARWALGWIAYEHNELETAIAHFEAIAGDRRRLHLTSGSEGIFGLALAYQASGMPLEARATLRHLTETVHELHALAYLPSLRLFEARLALLRGDVRSALESIGASDGSLAGNSFITFEHEVVSRVKVLIAHGTGTSLATAQGDVERLRAAAEAGRHRARLVEILALAALVQEALGTHEAALANLTRSVELGAPAGFCRTYVDLGPAIVPLLQELVERGVAPSYLKRVLSVISGGGAAEHRQESVVVAASPHVLDLLTLRESEVLDALCRRLSYQEIADELFISVHTVKSHTMHIYEKLGVANRRQALAKAASFGLAPRVQLAKQSL